MGGHLMKSYLTLAAVSAAGLDLPGAPAQAQTTLK